MADEGGPLLRVAAPIAPLVVVAGTGSPVNPIAVF
jgi:hypothetical protein